MTADTPIALLGMYDRPETAKANDRFWRAIREQLGHGPDNLSRDLDFWDAWQSPNLTFGQTCGYPYRAKLHDKVTLIGTPDYGVAGCPAGYYNSVIVARKDDPRQTLDAFDAARFAYNEPLSQSGWAAPYLHMASLGLTFGEKLQTGGHLYSARAVAEGRADFAALDAVSWEMMRRWDDFAEILQVIATTSPTPGLPYVAAVGTDAEQVFAAVTNAIKTLSLPDRETLQLRGITRISQQDYLTIPNPPSP